MPFNQADEELEEGEIPQPTPAQIQPAIIPTLNLGDEELNQGEIAQSPRPIIESPHEETGLMDLVIEDQRDVMDRVADHSPERIPNLSRGRNPPSQGAIVAQSAHAWSESGYASGTGSDHDMMAWPSPPALQVGLENRGEASPPGPTQNQEDQGARASGSGEQVGQCSASTGKARRANSSPERLRLSLGWFDASFIELANRLTGTERYPGLITHEVRLIKLYVHGRNTAEFETDSSRLIQSKCYFNEVFQDRYNNLEAVFGPNPLEGWPHLVKFQQLCDSILFQYMYHRRSCCVRYHCICHHSLNNGRPSPFRHLFDPQMVEDFKDSRLESIYRQFMQQLDWLWVKKIIALTRRVRSGVEPFVVDTPLQSPGYHISLFYTGREVQEEEDQDYSEDEILMTSWPTWMATWRSGRSGWSDYLP